MSISKRLYILLTTVIIALVTVASVNLYYMERVHQLADFANKDTVPSLQVLDKALLQFMKLRIRVYRYLVNTDPYASDDIEQSINQAKTELYQALDNYQAYISNATDRQSYAHDRKLIDQSVETLMRVMVLAKEHYTAEATTLLNEATPQAINAQDNIVQHINLKADLGRSASLEAVSVIHSTSQLTLLLSVSTVMIVLFLIFQIRSNLKSRQIAAIVTGSEDAIVSKTLDGRILNWNPGAEKIFGYTDTEAIGQSILMLYPPDRTQEEEQIMEKIRRGERVEHFETIRSRKDGSQLHMSVSVSPLRDEQGQIIGASLIGRDITRAKQAEEAIIAAKQEAEIANQAKSEFLANMSHEIRTPMNAIIGMTQLVLDDHPTPQQENYLKKVATSSKALLAILNEILDYSKIEAGKLAVESVPVKIKDLIQQSLDLFSTELLKKSLRIEVRIADNLPTVVLTDPLRLSQVMNNLLGNAIKFTEKGQISIQASLLSEEADIYMLRFAVSDTGIGITEAQASELFQPFVQADTTITRKYGGTGLGLAISQKLVSLMGGNMALSSEYGSGSTFAFTIRCQKASYCSFSEDQVDKVSQTSRQILEQVNGCRVLLAEDHEINQEIALAFLGKIAANVDVADNGKEAVAFARQSRYDIILMDLHMPELDGLEAAKQIRMALGAACPPIVAMSAAVQAEDRRQCLAAGMVDFLAKPLSFEDLIACLHQQIGGWHMKDDAALITEIPAQQEVFSLERLTTRLDHKLPLAVRLTHQCLESYKDAQRHLTDLLNRPALPEAGRYLHTLRGVLDNLGEHRLRIICLELEEQLKQGKIPEDVALGTFFRQLEQLLMEMQQVLSQQAPPTPTMAGIDLTQLLQLLSKLRPYLLQGEVAPDELLLALSGANPDTDIGSKIDELLHFIDAFDHASALNVLDRLASILQERQSQDA